MSIKIIFENQGVPKKTSQYRQNTGTSVKLSKKQIDAGYERIAKNNLSAMKEAAKNIG